MSLEAWLQQRSGARHICPALRRVGRLRQVEAVLAQRNQEVSEVLKSGARSVTSKTSLNQILPRHMLNYIECGGSERRARNAHCAATPSFTSR
jgi:hypothetical protein